MGQSVQKISLAGTKPVGKSFPYAGCGIACPYLCRPLDKPLSRAADS
jgi:hypothetical protein